MAADQPDIHAIFSEALEQEPAEERAKYLDEACGGDSAVRHRVDALLRAHAEAGGFFADRSGTAFVTQAIVNCVGSSIGPYKIREQIGEGGMGAVYVAEQSEPVRRKVALKIIRPGMASKDVVARFEAERQALAMMEHPNIARVFDGGTTETGQPFFVMELVQGVPITEYCDQQRMTVNERLQLFLNVCRAVQHAHQKGIIHRDIKPSNVLVPTIDGAAVPKVIDFGVAKAVSHKLTEETVYTQFTQMVGTPLYMSPEQAGMGVVDVDTRSDVYSLGVLLYELLTGQTPFDRETLKQASFDEMRRIIREEEPRRPSAMVSTLQAQALSTLAGSHCSDPRKLCDSLRGELDWIAMKALAKDRAQRYASANDMVADIERYLHNEPVLARPASTLYRVRKFTRRNRTLIVSAAFVFIALSLGFVMTTVGFLAAQQRLKEVTQEQEINKAVIELLGDMHEYPSGMEIRGREYTVLESLDKVSDDLKDRLRDYPKVQIEIRQIFARTYRRNGAYAISRDHLQHALDLSEREYGPTHEKCADVLTQFAEGYRLQAAEFPFDYTKSQEFAERALAIYDKIGVETHHTAHALYCLACSLEADTIRHDETESYLRRALQISQHLARGKDTTSQVFASWDLAIHLAKQKDDRINEANSLSHRAVEMSQRLHGDHSSLTANAMAVQGDCFRHQGNLIGALVCYRQAWDIHRTAGLRTERKGHSIALTLAETFHVAHRHREANEVLDEIEAICRADEMLDSLARCLYLRGWGHLLSEDYFAAETSLREAARLAEQNLGEFHEITAYSRFFLAQSLEAQGKLAEARLAFRQLLPLTQRLVRSKHASEKSLYGHAYALLHSGIEGHAQEALDAADRGLARAQLWPQFGLEPHLYLVKAIAQHELGAVEDAVKSLQTGLGKVDFRFMRPHRKTFPKSRCELEVTLAKYLVELGGDSNEAKKVYERGIKARLGDHLPPDHLQVALAELRFGAFLREQGQFERAEKLLLSAHEKLRSNPEAADANLARVATQLIALYTAMERPTEAAMWQRELDEMKERITRNENAIGDPPKAGK